MSCLCKSCDKPITKKDPGLQCSSFCGFHFHANSNCSDVNKNQLGVINSLPGGRWACELCRNSRTSTRSRTKSITEINSNSSNIAIAGDDSTEISIIQTVRQEMSLLRESVNFCSDKISDFENKLVHLDKYFKELDILKSENKKLNNDLVELNKKVKQMEQNNRINNIELQDIPETSNENLIDTVTTIGNFLKCKVEPNSIDTVFRVPSYMNKKPKNIVVKFISKIQRDSFLSAAKTARKMNSNQYGFKIDGISDKFFINEHLSPQTKILHKQTRDVSKQKGYKFVWIQNGNILVRKSETSKIIQVNESADLNKL